MGATSEQPLAASPPGADSEQVPLVLVSNRGPVTFDAAGEVQRGSGGVVTALTGLASHRRAVWIASAMSEYDAEVSRRNGERSFTVRSPSGQDAVVEEVQPAVPRSPKLCPGCLDVHLAA